MAAFASDMREIDKNIAIIWDKPCEFGHQKRRIIRKEKNPKNLRKITQKNGKIQQKKSEQWQHFLMKPIRHV